jgi:hypothetical protein
MISRKETKMSISTAEMIAAIERALAKGTEGPVEVGLPLEGVYIGGHPHVVWPIYHEDRRQEPDFAGIGVAVCILPREDDTPAERAYVEANARLIAALLNAAQGIVAAAKRFLCPEYGAEDYAPEEWAQEQVAHDLIQPLYSALVATGATEACDE